MKEEKSNKKYIICLIIIILLQVIFKIYIGNKKTDYFVDEIFSYGLMNYSQAYLFEREDFCNNWHNKEYFDDYLIISKEEALDWTPIYKNQMEDYHPPFYYVMLRIAASFTIEKFTKWTGLLLNIIIFIGCAITLYQIGNLLFKDKRFPLLLVLTYGFSKFSSENTLFIRMYQLLELQILLLVKWHIKNHNRKKIELKEFGKLMILITLGTLTHYYYLIFLIAIQIINIIISIYKKQTKNIIKYIITILLAQIMIFTIFPGYIDQLNKNFVRCNNNSTDTIEQEKEETAGIITREQKYLEIFNNHMFNIKISYIIIPLAIITIITSIIYHLRKNENKIQRDARIIYIVFPMLFYWWIITTTSPYIDLRYILPIFILVLITILYITERNLQIFKKNKESVISLIMIVCMIYIIPFIGNQELKYQYPSNKKMIDKVAQYKDLPCIYMYEDKLILQNNFTPNLNYVRQFENVYIMDEKEFSIEKLEEVLKEIDVSKGIILYDNLSDIDSKAIEIIQSMEMFNKYKRIVRFVEDDATKGAICILYRQ